MHPSRQTLEPFKLKIPADHAVFGVVPLPLVSRQRLKLLSMLCCAPFAMLRSKSKLRPTSENFGRVVPLDSQM
jgi:hypothetical protein